MSEYRINVRFSLEDAAQRRTAEFLETLDREQYGSRCSPWGHKELANN